MKRDNSLMKFTTFVLLITIVAIALVSGTYAKYASSVTGFDTATVAKWSIEVNNTQIATVDGEGNINNAVTFDLFNTIKDSDGSTDEQDVDTNLIAPGTSGSFALVIENLSDVNAEYAIDFTLTNPANVPLEFSTNGTNWGTLDSIDIDATAIDMKTGTATINVQWKWGFDGDHTAIGIAAQSGTSEVKVEATITVEQVD